MSSDNVSRKYKTLLSDGPMTAEALGGHPAVDERRIYDIQKYNPEDQTSALWYLPAHDTERVLRDWLETNKAALESNGINKRSLSQSLSNEWMDIWRDIKDEAQYDWLSSAESNAGGANGQGSMTCPKCGKEDVKNLPRHLSACDGEYEAN